MTSNKKLSTFFRFERKVGTSRFYTFIYIHIRAVPTERWMGGGGGEEEGKSGIITIFDEPIRHYVVAVRVRAAAKVVKLSCSLCTYTRRRRGLFFFFYILRLLRASSGSAVEPSSIRSRTRSRANRGLDYTCIYDYVYTRASNYRWMGSGSIRKFGIRRPASL